MPKTVGTRHPNTWVTLRSGTVRGQQKVKNVGWVTDSGLCTQWSIVQSQDNDPTTYCSVDGPQDTVLSEGVRQQRSHGP